MRPRDGERGHVLVTVALVLFVLIGFAVMTVDIGVASSARTQSQRAADAAALAGAFEFVTNPNLTGQALTDAITNSAKNTAAQNTILGTPVPTSDVTVSIDTANRRVTVALSHSTPTFFANIFGRSTMSIGATGVAEASKTATGSGCVKPFFIPNTILSGQVPFSDPCQACNSTGGTGLLVQYDAAGGRYKVTSWAQGLINAGTNEFVVKPGDPSNALRPGDFYEVDLN